MGNGKRETGNEQEKILSILLLYIYQFPFPCVREHKKFSNRAFGPDKDTHQGNDRTMNLLFILKIRRLHARRSAEAPKRAISVEIHQAV
jgi:hypothetical protein